MNVNNELERICKAEVWTLWTRALLQKLTVPQLVKNSADFLEPEISSSRPHQPTTYPYLEPDYSSPRPHPISWRPILILSLIYAYVFQVGSFPRFSHATPEGTLPFSQMGYINLRHYPENCLEGRRNPWRISFKKVSVPGEIRTSHLRNKSQNIYPHNVCSVINMPKFMFINYYNLWLFEALIKKN